MSWKNSNTNDLIWTGKHIWWINKPLLFTCLYNKTSTMDNLTNISINFCEVLFQYLLTIPSSLSFSTNLYTISLLESCNCNLLRSSLSYVGNIPDVARPSFSMPTSRLSIAAFNLLSFYVFCWESVDSSQQRFLTNTSSIDTVCTSFAIISSDRCSFLPFTFYLNFFHSIGFILQP